MQIFIVSILSVPPAGDFMYFVRQSCYAGYCRAGELIVRIPSMCIAKICSSMDKAKSSSVKSYIFNGNIDIFRIALCIPQNYFAISYKSSENFLIICNQRFADPHVNLINYNNV